MKRSNLFIYTPAQLLPTRVNFLLNRKLQPEIACQETPLEKLDFALLGESASQLHQHGLQTTLHAPFQDFNPGSSKRRGRKAAHKIATQSLQLAEKLGAKRVVFHPGLGYDYTAKELALWLKNSLEFWPEFLAHAAAINTVICIENIYEGEPEVFVELLGALNSPNLGHVFDIGHWNIFSSRNLSDWLTVTAPWLKHIHLHDNHGERDEHLAIGHGYVPFSTLFAWLKKSGQNPTMTLENHNLPDVERSLQGLERYFS